MITNMPEAFWPRTISTLSCPGILLVPAIAVELLLREKRAEKGGDIQYLNKNWVDVWKRWALSPDFLKGLRFR
ncbi:MAG: hypothetical protein HPY61_08120 [Methanotrichaceae archaeon]|nr:hypothetical protein [Methanotrichaceae archaeon]